MDKVLVLMTTYNRAELLPRPLTSLVNQTYKNFEVVIIDDGSEDNTQEVIKSFEDKIKIYYHKIAHVGRSKALNYGLKRCKEIPSNYICNLDSDDEYLPEFIEEHIKEFVNSDADVIYCDFLIDDKKHPQCCGEYTLDEMRIVNHVHNMVMYKSEYVFIPYNEKLTRFIDWDHWLTFMEYGLKFRHLCKGLVRIHPTQKSISKEVDPGPNDKIIKKNHNPARYFIAVYTNKCKRYCQEEFLNKLASLSYKNIELVIVDNTTISDNYNEIKRILEIKYKNKYEVIHLPPQEKKASEGDKFKYNVLTSVNCLRDRFLASDCDIFCIIESDVMVPIDLFEKFEKVKNIAHITGGIYYEGHHTEEDFLPQSNKFIEKGFVLSGCTIYSRELLQKHRFELSLQTTGAFPDAVMSAKAKEEGYLIGDYQAIKCDHVGVNGSKANRGHARVL